MPKDTRVTYAVECGLRLRRTRIALGFSRLRKFAEATGVSEDNLGSWERGVAMVPQEYVSKLKTLFGVSHDWIYAGDPSAMSFDLAVKLLRAEEEARED